MYKLAIQSVRSLQEHLVLFNNNYIQCCDVMSVVSKEHKTNTTEEEEVNIKEEQNNPFIRFP